MLVQVDACSISSIGRMRWDAIVNRQGEKLLSAHSADTNAMKARCTQTVRDLFAVQPPRRFRNALQTSRLRC